METSDGLCPRCLTYLEETGECPNRHCPAHGRTGKAARFSSGPAPRRSFQDFIAVRHPAPDTAGSSPGDPRDSGGADASEEDEDRPTPIEVPMSGAGIRRAMSGEYAVATVHDPDDKASNDGS